MSKLFFGTPEHIKERQVFPDRKSLIKAGLHRSTMHGIDGNGNEGVAAIVLSGGYEDDVDFGDEIIYTGHGGNDPNTKLQVADQSWEDHGNKGLVVSKIRSLPVRVIRGYKHNSPLSPKSGYRYGGLYLVTDSWEEIGKSNFIICRFKLVKQNTILNHGTNRVLEGTLINLKPTGKEPKWFSIGVESPKTLKAQKISKDGAMASHLIDKKVGDKIDFGIGFEILEIKKYLSS